MPSNHGPNETINVTMTAENDPVGTVQTVKCCCGKACKGVKGLEMHQRRFRILEGLNEDPLEFENQIQRLTAHWMIQNQIDTWICPVTNRISPLQYPV